MFAMGKVKQDWWKKNIQHSDLEGDFLGVFDTVSEDAGIEPGTVATRNVCIRSQKF